MNAMPLSLSAGMPEKKASNAARPPADAPMPTNGNGASPTSLAPCERSVASLLGASSGEWVMGPSHPEAVIRAGPALHRPGQHPTPLCAGRLELRADERAAASPALGHFGVFSELGELEQCS